MYLLATLPETYGAMYTIQKYNYPFNKTFEHYVHNVSNLSARLGMGVMDTIGFIEDKLIFVGSTPHIDNTSHKVNFKIRVTDSVIERFYSDPMLSNKQITIMLVRLAISLSEIYKPSLTHMAYLISQLQPQHSEVAYVDRHSRQELSQRQELSLPVRVTNPHQEVEPVISEKPVVSKKPAVPNKPKKIDSDVISKVTDTVSRIKETLSDARGTEVTTNPLLGDFLDL